MKQIGYVTQLEGNKAIIHVRRVSACGDKCGSCSGECHTQSIWISVKNSLNAKPGDYIEIAAETKTIMKAAFLVYIIPLISLIAGIGLGSIGLSNLGIQDNEFYSFLIGMIFLGISYLFLRKIDNNIRRNGVEQFIMYKIL